MKYFLTLFALFLLTEFRASCQPAKDPPLITLKAGIFNSAINGTDYRSYELKNSVFFQPGISGGVLFKNLVYVGISGSKYVIFKYKDAYGFERNILAVEAGIPVSQKSIIGILAGRDRFDAPYLGHTLAGYKFKSLLLGVFIDYRINQYLSIPVKIAASKDPAENGIGNYLHFSLGLTGNLPVY